MNSTDLQVVSAIGEIVRVSLLSGEDVSLPGLGLIGLSHVSSTGATDARGTIVSAPAAKLEFKPGVSASDESVLRRAATLLNSDTTSVQTAWQNALNRFASTGSLSIQGVADFERVEENVRCDVNHALRQAINARYTGYIDLAVLKNADHVGLADGYTPDPDLLSAEDFDYLNDVDPIGELESDARAAGPVAPPSHRADTSGVIGSTEAAVSEDSALPAGRPEDPPQPTSQSTVRSASEPRESETHSPADLAEPDRSSFGDVEGEATDLPSDFVGLFESTELSDSQPIDDAYDGTAGFVQDPLSDRSSQDRVEVSRTSETDAGTDTGTGTGTDTGTDTGTGTEAGTEAGKEANAGAAADPNAGASGRASGVSTKADPEIESEPVVQPAATRVLDRGSERRRPVVEPARRSPIVGYAVAVSAVVLLAAAAYTLWGRSGDPAAAANSAEVSLVAPEAALPEQPVESPPDPTPEIVFARGAIDQSAGGFTIIVASKETESEAGAEAATIAIGDLPVDVFNAEVAGQTRYRVAIGQFRTFALASRALKQNAGRLPDGSWIGRIE